MCLWGSKNSDKILHAKPQSCTNTHNASNKISYRLTTISLRHLQTTLCFTPDCGCDTWRNICSENRFLFSNCESNTAIPRCVSVEKDTKSRFHAKKKTRIFCFFQRIREVPHPNRDFGWKNTRKTWLFRRTHVLIAFILRKIAISFPSLILGLKPPFPPPQRGCGRRVATAEAGFHEERRGTPHAYLQK